MFQTGPIADLTDAGPIRGIQKEIACQCYFTRTGRTKPLVIKVMDQEGAIHTIPILEVLSTEGKCFSGIQTTEYICKIELFGSEKVVKLVFDKLASKWKLISV